MFELRRLENLQCFEIEDGGYSYNDKRIRYSVTTERTFDSKTGEVYLEQKVTKTIGYSDSEIIEKNKQRIDDLDKSHTISSKILRSTVGNVRTKHSSIDELNALQRRNDLKYMYMYFREEAIISEKRLECELKEDFIYKSCIKGYQEYLELVSNFANIVKKNIATLDKNYPLMKYSDPNQIIKDKTVFEEIFHVKNRISKIEEKCQSLYDRRRELQNQNSNIDLNLALFGWLASESTKSEVKSKMSKNEDLIIDIKAKENCVEKELEKERRKYDTLQNIINKKIEEYKKTGLVIK